MWRKRSNELVAIVLVGDGVIGLVQPRRHAQLWKVGPAPLRALMEVLAERPWITQLAALGQIVFGVWWAAQQQPEEYRP